MRRPGLALRALRGIAVLSLTGLLGVVGYQELRSAGFTFRWEVDDPRGGPPPARAGRSAEPGGPRPREVPAPRIAATSGDVPGTVATDDLALDVPHSGAGAIGAGESASIDFEGFGAGRPFCTNCPVSDQWSPQGLILSYRSWSASSTLPYVLDARNFLPPGASTHALGPALSGERGLEVGVVRLDFPGRPRKVAFTLYGPDLIRSFSITVWSDGEELPRSATFRALDSKYNPAGRGRFRAERIVVESPRGVDRISLDGWGPPGHVLLVDDLSIHP